MDFPLVPVQLGEIYACLMVSAIRSFRFSFRFSTGWLKSAVFYLLAPHCLVDNPPRWAKAYPYGGLAPTNHLIANNNDQNSDKSITPAGESLQKTSQFAQQTFSTGSTAQQTGSTQKRMPYRASFLISSISAISSSVNCLPSSRSGRRSIVRRNDSLSRQRRIRAWFPDVRTSGTASPS